MRATQKFQPENYLGVNYDDLLVYALHSLEKGGKIGTFENLVAECFQLFPRRFSLPGHLNWPDASLVEKSWVRCRTDKGWLRGNKATGFGLTDTGKDRAFTVSRLLGKTTDNKEDLGIVKGRNSGRRTQSSRVVGYLEKHPLFKRYLHDKEKAQIEDEELLDMLYCTSATEPYYRKQVLAQLEEHVKVYKRKDLINFLRFCRKLKGGLFISKKGMMG